MGHIESMVVLNCLVTGIHWTQPREWGRYIEQLFLNLIQFIAQIILLSIHLFTDSYIQSIIPAGNRGDITGKQWIGIFTWNEDTFSYCGRTFRACIWIVSYLCTYRTTWQSGCTEHRTIWQSGCTEHRTTWQSGCTEWASSAMYGWTSYGTNLKYLDKLVVLDPWCG